MSGILKETCEALWHVLQSVYVKAPSNEDTLLGGATSLNEYGIF